jgi:serine protease Do
MYENGEQGGVNLSSGVNNNSSENTNESVNYGGGAFSGYSTYNNNYNNGYNGGSSPSNSNISYGNYSYSQNAQNTQNNAYGYNNGGYSYGAGQQTNPQQQTYGTYQYSSTIPNQGMEVPVKKKSTAGIVVAAVAILALLVGGVGAAYYTYANGRIDATSVAQVTENNEDSQKTAKLTESTGNSETTSQSTEEKVQAKTVSAQTSVVVTDVTSVVAEVMPAMVIIHNNYTQSQNYFGYQQTQEATASGSGIIVGQNDSELLIATNYHVIEGADSLEVIFNDESTLEAVVKGTNSDMDLAVIAVMLDDISSSTMNAIKIATLGDSEALVLGEPAIAIGNALGYGQSVTTGVISALNRSVELDDGSSREFIQTDAAINPGNSGGALLNLQGEVIGINSNKIGGDTVEGMGYAIPISAAKPIIEQLMNEETKIKVADADRGYIGISGVSVTSEVSAVYGLPQGVYVADVTSGSGADAAGLEKGDVIVGFEGYEITSMDDLQNRLQYYAAGATVTIEVMRQNGSEYVGYTVDVTLGGANSGNKAADENGSSGQYDGSTNPGMPEDRSHGGSNGSGH